MKTYIKVVVVKGLSSFILNPVSVKSSQAFKFLVQVSVKVQLLISSSLKFNLVKQKVKQVMIEIYLVSKLFASRMGIKILLLKWALECCFPYQRYRFTATILKMQGNSRFSVTMRVQLTFFRLFLLCARTWPALLRH